MIPITVEGESNVKVGPNFDGSYCVSSKDISLRLSESKLSLSIQDKLSINGDASSLEIVMANGGTYLVCDYTNNTVIRAHLNEGTPYYYDVLTATEHWTGYVCTKTLEDVDYNISQFAKEDFTVVLAFDDEGNITVVTEQDITVDRDGTKLEVKDGKVVITGDLEVNGKATISDTATITGMKTDVQRFFADLTSAMNSMFTLGSPATHQMDGAFKSNLAILRSKL